MGQAKKRGSFEERVKQAQVHQDNFYGISASVEDIRKELGLPDDAQSIGYVIHLPDQDEFVADIIDNDMAFSVAYAKLPKMAKAYDKPKLAIADAKKITKHKLLVCVLFESSKQYMINDIWSNY
ncbi:hypothetical protein F994_00970 [Acinetobacter bohemicus ANC 3994]|uniref:Uncharacterized protein n=1 Tax=Acinetobacter bohemicus ANC 3994 TaxID=1217715 RepID=N8QFS4_9GAMM|nr:hypothetical protein [Acinetobacter bohemicus]ENU20737.1 hypothetical protein F994_00970 [Acinetobacter bohemicus ANC 3994]